MLGRHIRTSSNSCGGLLAYTSNVNRELFRFTSVIYQSTKTKEISDIQRASLDSDICLLVDEKDNFIGTATKRDCHRVSADGKLLLHRAFSVLMFNSAGELLVQKRAAGKVTYPNAFTNTCCSHPLFIDGMPEDVTTAAIRRLNEELGIPKDQLRHEDFTFISRFLYADYGDGAWGEYELDHVLILRSDAKVKPNPEEIDDVKYIPRNKINSFMEHLKDPVTPWFRLIYHHLLLYRWDNLHRLKDIAEPQKIQSFLDKK